MNSLREILNTNNYKRITLKNNVKIIDTDEGSFVIKKNTNKLDNTFKYLKSRAFDYFPEKIYDVNDYDIYEYIEDIKEPQEQKILDLINLLSLLHNKTTFYKEVDIDNYKEIYEDVLNKYNYLLGYYEDIISLIEQSIYMAPSSYLIARNINKIFASLNYCKIEIEKWYDLVKDKRRIRYVNIHNNLKIDHYIRKEKSYFISWDKNKIDMPIMDILVLYKNHYLDFDFIDLLKYYENRYPLLEEERKLLFILMTLPEKIELNDNEYNMCIKIRKFIDYIYKTEELILNYEQVKNTN